jgi:ElaA protein
MLPPGGPFYIEWRSFEELSRQELYGLLMLRADVFVLEQRSFFRDIDGGDRRALHLLLREGECIAGTLRLLPLDDGSVAIGRVALAPHARGRGNGRRMLQAALNKIAETWGAVPVVLGAQAVQEGFYAAFGFVPQSDPYDDEGILHIDMRREP